MFIFIYKGTIPNLLGGWTNPFEKYARQIGSSPQIGAKLNILETTTYCYTWKIIPFSQ